MLEDAAQPPYAKAFNLALAFDYAKIIHIAKSFDFALVFDYTKIIGFAKAFNFALAFDYAKIIDSANACILRRSMASMLQL